MSSEKLNFQQMILRLLEYWQAQGCLVWQPYNVQVGAGTMNPATILRVLGPEPWNIVYVEPSIRPDDGRFGDNPNRMQQHYQLQVILKPDPGNPIELYLGSLEAIGISQREHDIRFVEDNWQSPALGAWGLGWEVWLDGQEITQYTYFQQAGGHNLDPVSVEITYGLDRIALALQGKNSVWEMDYGAGVKYGDALLQAEIEHCKYYFDVADVDALKMIYDTYEREAYHCLDAGLVAPAHDYNLKCSQLFNVLDTRGAIGVTERAHYFGRMRRVANKVSSAYIEQRERLEYPLSDNKLWNGTSDGLQATGAEDSSLVTPNDGAPFVLEIGSEELPHADLTAALAQLRAAVPAMLDAARLRYDGIEVEGTPRRLAVMVSGLAARQSDLESVVKGPPADRAFDKDGKPTPAAAGFARSRGLSVDDLSVVEEGGKRYVSAVVREEGRPSLEVLAEALPGLIAGIRFEKSMRWNATNISYSRPLRWLLALHGPAVVGFEYAGARSGRQTYGLRPFGSPIIEIAHAADYRQAIADATIVLSMDARRETIAGGVAALARSKGGMVPDDPALLDEVTNLVERPTPLLGAFEERFLALPPMVLVAVMRKHQRYFPLYKGDKLLPFFIAVRNGDDQHLDMVRHGNEQVIRARFADAAFFYDKDIKHRLEEFVPRLSTLTFQTELGSLLDKTRRLEQLTPVVAGMLGLDASERATARRAAELAKADLATNMVVEMTSLQGKMGGHYALLSSESPEVAAAISGQYDAVSGTRPGMAVAIADRLDSLAGLFAAGLGPKGSNDPFALRRAALHLIENLTANRQNFDLRAGLDAAGALLPVAWSEQAREEVLAFIAGRLDVVLRDAGHPASVVKAVLAEQTHNPYAASKTAAALAAAIQAPDWEPLLDAYARCVRITRPLKESYALRPGDLRLPEETALATDLVAAEAAGDGTVQTFVASLRAMEPAITRLFDAVLIMDEDAAVRENRLALLQRVAGLARGVADLSALEGF
ncbi:MAG: glycine--tRNA ligase subunit beta [Anaerolineae bacterium]|nr:glycine--tRNA ligase subunit beta [Anaerolineae bacterium]RIK23713.1 MAG: glycine--tRNA ligase subunit alpha/beta [Anaerolineae bacterium]